MKKVLLFWIITASSLSYSQSEFIQEARYHLPRKDSLYTFKTAIASADKHDYYSDSTIQLELILNELLRKGNRNRADTLKQSLVLTQLSTLCVKRIHSITPLKVKQKRSLEKRIRRIFFGSNCCFGLIETISFEIPLVKSKGHFHYNKKGADGGFNLYEGKSKPKATKENPEPNEIPLETYTYEELKGLIQIQFNRKKVNRFLAEKSIAAFGYYMQLDESTIQKNKIPTVKVLLILGMKRFSYKQRRSFHKKTSTNYS
ncbi:hypothetical protein [Fluviicola taffensis]|uniref:Uncharacterized protein n=1 Tax=Fluviicola taffensis (strain DSM 16823 / NCIMB 13979 / RW262) TaxID=755732 RepID=F2IGW3_FLUTR|nr:hypothetical protein [Fluviicola taffensis]AEA44744.1 hypothetical protein Fluta_2764 [Fluviicola taffensis DSM 16823]